MSPDLEWRVDDPSGEQTIAKTTPPRTPRWRGIVIVIVICLGIGFGVAYTSLPEPPKPNPTPTFISTPAPPAMPVALYQTIVREANALQAGKRSELVDLLDDEDPQYQPYLSGSGNFQIWGRPRTDQLFTMGDFGFLSNERAWVEVSQYREGRTFHETRFYRLQNGQWKRTMPAVELWSGQPDFVDTLHFRIVYNTFDRQFVPAIATQLEHAYEQLCTDLECERSLRQCVIALNQDWCSSFTTSPTITLRLSGNDWRQSSAIYMGPQIVIPLLSPRVTGFYDKDDPLPYPRSPTAWYISDLLVQQAAYDQITFSGLSYHGEVLIEVITWRALARLQASATSAPIEDYWTPSDYDIKHPLPLASLWEKLDSTNMDRMYAQASALIHYIEQTYGWPAMVKLLKSIKQADSMSDLIELSLDLPLADLEAQWQTWLKSYGP